ncbi:MAG: hypothetical protein AB4080_24090 [Trichodesmium sp.]
MNIWFKLLQVKTKIQDAFSSVNNYSSNNQNYGRKTQKILP